MPNVKAQNTKIKIVPAFLKIAIRISLIKQKTEEMIIVLPDILYACMWNLEVKMIFDFAVQPY